MNRFIIYFILLDIFLNVISTTENVTFKNVNITIIVRTPLKGGYDERVRVTETLSNSNYLMEVLQGRNSTIFNSLKIENQQMPIIHENAFEGLNLMKLSIVNCDTEVIEKKAFKNILKLDDFVMTNTSLDVVLRGVFEDLPVKSLDLSHNKIRVIESGAFASSTNLEEIILIGNQLTELRHGVFVNLLSLKNLDLQSNFIKKIEERTFINLPKLTRLWLQGNQLKVLNNSIFGK